MKKQMTVAQWLNKVAREALKNILEDCKHESKTEVLQAVAEGQYFEWYQDLPEFYLSEGFIILPSKGKYYSAYQRRRTSLEIMYESMGYQAKEHDLWFKAWADTLYNALESRVKRLAAQRLQKGGETRGTEKKTA